MRWSKYSESNFTAQYFQWLYHWLRENLTALETKQEKNCLHYLKPFVSCNCLYPLLQLLQEGSRLNHCEGTEERANCTNKTVLKRAKVSSVRRKECSKRMDRLYHFEEKMLVSSLLNITKIPICLFWFSCSWWDGVFF